MAYNQKNGTWLTVGAWSQRYGITNIVVLSLAVVVVVVDCGVAAFRERDIHAATGNGR